MSIIASNDHQTVFGGQALLDQESNMVSSSSSINKSFNPNQLSINQACMILDIYDNKLQNIDNCIDQSLTKKRINRLIDLINGNRDKYVMHDQYYDKLMDNVFTAFKSIPQINDLQSSKPIIPIFDEIEKQNNDSVEIKKFIRKCNFEFIGYHCNHSVIDEKCDKIYKNMTDIYKSAEYGVYKEFIQKCISSMGYIIDLDKRDQFKDDDYDLSDRSMLKIDSSMIQRTFEAVAQLNGKITECNSKSIKTCSKCDAITRKYKYCIREIQDMRNELIEQQKANEQPDENKYNIDSFMNKNYPTMNRFTLSEVQKKYKSTFGLSIKQVDLSTMIESTHKFKITNSGNIKYVTRL